MAKRKVAAKKPFAITTPMIRELIKVVDAGLVHGGGTPELGNMCVENAVVYATEGGATKFKPNDDDPDDMREDTISDHPQCVNWRIADDKIHLNDEGNWDDDDSRGQGLKRAAIAQLGSKGNFDLRTYRRLIKARSTAYVDRLKFEVIGKLANDNDWQGITEIVEQFVNYDGDKTLAVDDIPGYLDLVNEIHPPSWDEDTCAAFVAEELVQVLIKMKIPGTKFLNMTKPPRFVFV